MVQRKFVVYVVDIEEWQKQNSKHKSTSAYFVKGRSLLRELVLKRCWILLQGKGGKQQRFHPADGNILFFIFYFFWIAAAVASASCFICLTKWMSTWILLFGWLLSGVAGVLHLYLILSSAVIHFLMNGIEPPPAKNNWRNAMESIWTGSDWPLTPKPPMMEVRRGLPTPAAGISLSAKKILQFG